VNWSACEVAEGPPLDVATTTSTVPEPAGEVALQVVAVEQLTAVAASPPNVTVAVWSKPVPVIVTGVPPANGPESGVTELTVGGPT
jgi:hypothetical protein